MSGTENYPDAVAETRLRDALCVLVGAAVEGALFAGGTTLERAQRSVFAQDAYQVCRARVAAVYGGHSV